MSEHIQNRPEDFIAKLRPGADQCEKEKGIPASFTIAQAALESGWGSSALSTVAANLFGVKADKSWKGRTLSYSTREFLGGEWRTVPAVWRVYDDWAECLLDHAEFFKVNPRYSKALQFAHDGKLFARAIALAGYATDPLYGDKLISIISKHHLDTPEHKII